MTLLRRPKKKERNDFNCNNCTRWCGSSKGGTEWDGHHDGVEG